MRRPNTTCVICGKGVYRRPWEIEHRIKNVYCSKACMQVHKPPIPDIRCGTCCKHFHPEKRTVKYCSKICASKATKNRQGTSGIKNGHRNKSQARLETLQRLFHFESCMVENCIYSKTYDIHRLIRGKDGGEYEIGNMFAICPNHHAEETRGLIKFYKINEYTLGIIEE